MEQQLIVTIKYYEENIRVELPTNYVEFINCLSNMLQIEKEMIKTFKIYYNNSSDNKQYFIENSINYILFLNSVKNNNTDIIYIELSDNKENKIEINNNNNQNININLNLNKQQKNEEKDEDDNLINPYKESFIPENKKLSDELIIKHNSNSSGNILNNIDDNNDSIEFSFLDEKKLSKENINYNNNININNNRNENKINNINNNNNNMNNINNNNMNNNIINKNINSYYGQNKLVDNQIRGAPISVNFNIECNFCNNNKIIGVIFYCKNCSKFFCSKCEEKISTIHPHCYYKIRNKEQFEEICKIHNNNNNKLKNPYDTYNNNFKNNNFNNNNRNNNISSNENTFTDLLSEGSKIIGNTINNTFNSVINFFNLNNNQNQNNNNSNNNNNVNNRNNINNINNRSNNINNQNNSRNNSINNNGNNNSIQLLVEKAKSQYNLDQIDDEEIERALIICKGNIDRAVALLLSNHNK